jgi:hypothetical protein
MVTLAVPLSWEVGEGLPKVRELWWDLSLGPYRGMGAEFIRLAARSLIKGSLRSELSHNYRTPHFRTGRAVAMALGVEPSPSLGRVLVRA